MERTPKVLILFYVLLGYVLAQFAWWAYSIYDLNVTLAQLEFDMMQEIGVDSSGYASSMKGKVWMILGEGSVFLALLLIGAFYIRRFVMREHRLARQERNFLLATTHEFNSPIAAVKLNLQTLAKREVSDEQKNKLLAAALSSNDRLELLVTNLLMASRLDAGKLELLEEKVDLSAFLKAMTARYLTLAEQSSCQLETSGGSGIHLMVDRNALETVFGNLIENAIKYAPGSNIEVGYSSTHDGGIDLFVKDQGPGIPRDEKANVFKKFYRAENEETRSQKGSGLGLYLVKELVELHGGVIRVEDNTPKGATLILTFKTKAG